MLGMQQIALHVALCNAALRAPAQTAMTMRLLAYDRVGDKVADKTVRFRYDPEYPKTETSFGVPQGIYRLGLSLPRYRCGAVDYLDVIPGRNRTVDESLVPAPVPAPQPFLFQGTLPQAFMYVKPAFVLFPPTVKCKGAVGTPLASNIRVEDDQDAYYAAIFPSPAVAPYRAVTVALALTSASGDQHFIRLPMQYPLPWGGWPDNVNMNITASVIDDVATDPFDTLSCPHFYKTSVSG